jgi:MORN repeat variant
VIALVLALALLADPPSGGAAAAEPFSCPAGAERQGALPPDGFEVWCERPAEAPGQRREGPARTFYDDGGLAKASAFRRGRLHGTFTEWHRNGKPARAGAYEDGEREGLWTLWYEGGRVEEECAYARGERHGRFASFHPNGRRKVEGRYCRGVQCGTWTTWDEEGRELGKVQYEEIRGTP